MRFVREWALAIALYLALVLDGALSFYLHQFLHIGSFAAATWFMPIGVMLIALFDDTNKREIWLALGAGIVADIFSAGIIGVYTVFLPLASYCCQRIARFLPETFWARLLVVLLGLSLLDAYSWGIFTLVNMTTASFHVMLMSLLFNLVWSLFFFILSYWIWGRLAQNYPFLIDLSAYEQ